LTNAVEAEIRAYATLQRQTAGSVLHEAGYDISCTENVMPPNNRVTRLFGGMVASHSVESALDVGCGTGILALIAARRCGRVAGIDIDPVAVECARGNALRNQVGNVEFGLGDTYEGLSGRRFDLIFSNPPFYPAGPLFVVKNASLLPVQANGLIEGLIHGARDHLKPGGQVLFVTSSLSDNCGVEALFARCGHAYRRCLLGDGGGTSQDIFLWEFQAT
jgi:release factor glutamine methyltransferase